MSFLTKGKIKNLLGLFFREFFSHVSYLQKDLTVLRNEYIYIYISCFSLTWREPFRACKVFKHLSCLFYSLSIDVFFHLPQLHITSGSLEMFYITQCQHYIWKDSQIQVSKKTLICFRLTALPLPPLPLPHCRKYILFCRIRFCSPMDTDRYLKMARRAGGRWQSADDRRRKKWGGWWLDSILSCRAHLYPGSFQDFVRKDLMFKRLNVGKM